MIESGLTVNSPSGITPGLLFEEDLITFFTPESHRTINLLFTSSHNSPVENLTVQVDDENTYSIRTRSGENPYRFSGHSISIQMKDAVLTSVDYYIEEGENEAILTDLEDITYWNRETWRQKEYELFSWNLFPSMLIMDTSDYDVQSRFFKRLAFFVEKKGAAGELLSNGELEPLHGWNAHDYKSDDLARFFNEAVKLNFPLNPEELKLKELLIAHGVFKESAGGRVRPLGGGILSFSRQSNDRLRWLFLTHECYHGIFFASQEYTDSVWEIWNALTEEEKDFWRIFLDMYGYNVSDEYLLVNEFQAYLMQQDTSLAEGYFRGKINWILGLRPYLRAQMNSLLEIHERPFEKSAVLVENSALSLTGIKAGDLVLKRKK